MEEGLLINTVFHVNRDDQSPSMQALSFRLPFTCDIKCDLCKQGGAGICVISCNPLNINK